LRDLLGLDGVRELGREGDMGDGHIVEDEVEPPSPAGQVVPHQTGDHLSLGDELRGVELGDHGLEHLVYDGREDALVVVGAEVTVDGGQVVHGRSGQHSAGDVDLESAVGPMRGDRRTICRSLVPVREAMLRGLARTS